MKVLLVCAAGMSTGILVKKLEKYASDQGIDFQIKATSVNSYEDICHEYDCILLGPQVSYRKDQVATGSGMPVAVIPPQDYGMGNCAAILELAQSIIK